MVTVVCEVCGKTESVFECRAKTYATCSKACAGIRASKLRSTKVELTCQVCNKVFYEKPSHAHERKTCSRECLAKLKTVVFKGEGNHQFGLRGAERGRAWKGGKRISSWGYVLINVGYKDYQFEHRLVMERELGRKLLPTEHVHHINEVRTDNRIENLLLLSEGEHVAHHNKQNPMPRDPVTQRFTSK